MLAIHTKATAYSRMANYEEAIKVLDEGLKINDGWSLALLDKASHLTALERYDEALQCYKQVEQDSPFPDLYQRIDFLLLKEIKFLRIAEI